MKSRELRRRRFIQIGASAALVGSAVSCSRRGGRWRFFTIEEARTVEALCERIIPADGDPGAKDAGVVGFIDRQLAGFYKDLRDTYRTGLGAVERTSESMFGARFVSLGPANQNAVLSALEKSADKPFFDLLVAHTMQGFYGDPRHGGNRDGVSWKMLGVPYPPIRGRVKG
jgi:gluconate 2-dehydrogenase gamma chain